MHVPRFCLQLFVFAIFCLSSVFSYQENNLDFGSDTQEVEPLFKGQFLDTSSMFSMLFWLFFTIGKGLASLLALCATSCLDRRQKNKREGAP
jgi:hypothetical protein